jgi:uncharacterized protein YbjT (DUF2867 family)
MKTATLVTGGTATGGRLVVARLREAGVDVRALRRRSRPARSAAARTSPSTELWGRPTWEEFLADRVGSSADGGSGRSHEPKEVST